MADQPHDLRIFLKDALPRLYAQVHATLRKDRPALLEQLEALYLVDRCRCGSTSCVSFMCESASARFAPINGRRPVSYRIDDLHGWYSVSDSGILSGFEILDDYRDGYLDRRLVELGFGRNAPTEAPDADTPATGRSDREAPPDDTAGGSDGSPEGSSGCAIFMTPVAHRHLVAYRMKVQSFEPEQIVEFCEVAMDESATPDGLIAEDAVHPALLSVPKTVDGISFQVRMPVKRARRGFDLRTVIPEGISGPVVLH